MQYCRGLKIVLVVVLAVVVVVMVVVVVAKVVVVGAEVQVVLVVAEVEVVVVVAEVVAEVIVVLAAQTICLLKGMVLIDVCRKNYNNPGGYSFKPVEIVCSRLMLICPA